MFSARIASSKDIPLLQQLGKASFYPTYLPFISQEQVDYMYHKMYDEPSLYEQIEIKKHNFVVAFQSERPIGFASFQKDFDDDASSKLHKLYILPALQTTGAGKFLLQFVEQLAAKEGQKNLLLNVNRYNKAVDFYKHLGYQIIAIDDIDIGNGYFMNDYEMKKELQ